MIVKSKRIPVAAAYSRALQRRALVFERHGEKIVDRDTGSEWDIFGRAVAGPLHGARLETVESGVHFAFAWLAFNPRSEIYGAK